MEFDYVIVGGGIVGCASALAIRDRFPKANIGLLEKERTIGLHQTSHNSGVVHAGVYYKPGSFKAKFCRQGNSETIDFCKRYSVPFERCGKVLVAISDSELGRMRAIFERCKENGLDPEYWDGTTLQEREPNITGVGAIHIKSTAIVDYSEVTSRMAELAVGRGVTIVVDREVKGFEESAHQVRLVGDGFALTSRYVVVCAGLMADRLAASAGIDVDFRIVPFRGNYYSLPENLWSGIKRLVYPIPDPNLPFLGVHFTRLIHGGLVVGPNAILAFKREGYGRREFSIRDTHDSLRFGGFWRMMGQHWRSAAQELGQTTSKHMYAKLCRQYWPGLSAKDLAWSRSGVRAQAVLRDGSMVDDFMICRTARTVHVCNAPSPAATSAMPIGRYIAGLVETS